MQDQCDSWFTVKQNTVLVIIPMSVCLLVPTLVKGIINRFPSKANTEWAPIWGFLAFFAV